MITTKTTIEIANERDEFVLNKLSEPNIIKEARKRDRQRWALIKEQKKIINELINEVELSMSEDCPTDVSYHNALLLAKKELFGDE